MLARIARMLAPYLPARTVKVVVQDNGPRQPKLVSLPDNKNSLVYKVLALMSDKEYYTAQQYADMLDVEFSSVQSACSILYRLGIAERRKSTTRGKKRFYSEYKLKRRD